MDPVLEYEQLLSRLQKTDPEGAEALKKLYSNVYRDAFNRGTKNGMEVMEDALSEDLDLDEPEYWGV